MIELKEIGFKNFLSYGNTLTTYTFEKGITRISGVNGQGKSALVDAIYFGFFGKAYRRINIPKLVNSINKKGLEVHLIFDSKGIQYKVFRGIKPDFFRIFKDSKEVDQEATKKGFQQYLEDDVIQLTSDIFEQIGIKSLTRYDSFLTLSKGRKRHIIESIFGILILSIMKDLNKQKIDDLETVVYGLKKDENKYQLLKEQEKKNLEKLKLIKRQLEQDLERKNENKKLEIIEIKKKMLNFSRGLGLIEKREQERNKLQIDKFSANESIKNIISQKRDIENKIVLFEGNICFIKERCPECPNITSFETEGDITELNSEKEKYEKEIEKISQQYNKYVKLLDEANKFIANKALLEIKIEDKKREIQKIKDSIQTHVQVVEIDETNFKKYKSQLKKLEAKIEKKNSELNYLKAIYSVLSDDGIKSHIVKKYLPILNKLMNTYLQRFSIDLELEFTSELEIEIKTKFKEDYAYESFSEGEKRRINLALTFTFLEFCKLKYSSASINILILDEFTSGLDPEGENVMYDILKDIVKKEEKEVITISHTELIDPDKINRIFHVGRERGFSRLEMLKEA